MKHLNYIENFCNCLEPEHSEIWASVGVGNNIIDYQLCDTCECPIIGTSTTHTIEEE